MCGRSIYLNRRIFPAPNKAILNQGSNSKHQSPILFLCSFNPNHDAVHFHEIVTDWQAACLSSVILFIKGVHR